MRSTLLPLSTLGEPYTFTCLLRRSGYAFQARRVVGIASKAQQELADLMGHHLLHHESSLSCIKAQGTGQTMTDPRERGGGGDSSGGRKLQWHAVLLRVTAT